MNFNTLLKLIEEPQPRWLLSIAAAGTMLFFLPPCSPEFRSLAAWDVGVLSLLILVWLMMLSSDATTTRDRAQRQEIDHSAIFLLVIFAAFASLFAIGGVLAKHKDRFTPEVVLSIVAIFCSWLLMHTIFALHYAAFYYRKRAGSETELMEGLEFASQKPPDYLDFIYFAFTLGMTSQTSDTAIVTSAMRRLVLGHTIVSFYFYSVILALSISIIAGLL